MKTFIRNINKQHIYTFLKILFLFLLLYMPIFGFLDSLPIRKWDEARRSFNALEMSQNHNFIVTHFEGNPDMWGTKPPLLIWAQVFFIKLLGFNELAIRMPSAIAAFLTCSLLMVFALRYFKSYLFGIIAVLVLITTPGYVCDHVSRTGDFDALLTFFTTLGSIFFFIYTENNKSKYIYGFFLAIALGVLTKGVAALFFTPAWLIYGLIRKKIIPLLTNKHFYFALGAFLIITVGFYLLREMQNPGYFAAVRENELGGRYLKTIEDHDNNFWFYFQTLQKHHFSAWYIWALSAMVLGIFFKDKKISRLAIFTSLLSVIFLVIISNSKTKLFWYDAQIFPLLALLTALIIHQVFNILKDIPYLQKNLRIIILPYLFLIIVFFTPYQKTIKRTYMPQEKVWDKEFYAISHFMKDAVNGKYQIDGFDLVYNGYDVHLDFYVFRLAQKGVHVNIIEDYKSLKPGDQVIVPDASLRDLILKQYQTEIISEQDNGIVLLKILEPSAS